MISPSAYLSSLALWTSSERAYDNVSCGEVPTFQSDSVGQHRGGSDGRLSPWRSAYSTTAAMVPVVLRDSAPGSRLRCG